MKKILLITVMLMLITIQSSANFGIERFGIGAFGVDRFGTGEFGETTVGVVVKQQVVFGAHDVIFSGQNVVK